VREQDVRQMVGGRSVRVGGNGGVDLGGEVRAAVREGRSV
jgi:hypothetical protein